MYQVRHGDLWVTRGSYFAARTLRQMRALPGSPDWTDVASGLGASATMMPTNGALLR